MTAWTRLIAAFTFAASVLSCGRAESPRDTAGAGGEPSATTAARPQCGVGAATTLTGDGLGDLRVGARVADVRRACRVVRDTTAPGQEGQPERVISVDLGRDAVRAIIQADRVWRVHVQTPAFRTADSLGVGTPGSALRRPDAKLLMGEGAVYVTLPSHCGMSFRLSGVQFGRLRTPAQIPDTARVAEVLAFGC